MYRAMTRPRIDGSVVVWMVAFAVVIMVSAMRPTGTHATA